MEKNGQLRAVIANTDRMPDPIVNGKTFKIERVPGMIFYNGLGAECGGLIFGADDYSRGSRCPREATGTKDGTDTWTFEIPNTLT